MSIKLRILLTVLLLELIGYGILLSYNINASKHALGDVREHQIMATLTAHRNLVDAQTDLIERSVLDLAGLGEHFLLLKQQRTAQDLEPLLKEALKTHFKRFPAAVGGGLWYEPFVFNPDQKHFGPYVYRQESEVVFTWELNTEQYDYLNQSWYLTALPIDWPRDRRRPQSVYWTELYVDEAGSNALMMTADAPMYGDEDQIVGMATVDWAMEDMRQFVAAMSITPGARSFLIDKQSGRFVNFGLDESLVMEPVAQFDWADQIRAQSLGSDILRQPDVHYNDRHYALWTTATRAGLVLGAMIPTEDLLGELEPLLARNFWIGACISLVFVMIVGAMLRLLFRQFDRVLNKILASVHHKEGQLRLNPLPERLGNEFDPILKALNEVYSAVHLYTRQLLDANDLQREQQQEIHELNQTLEARIARRTQDLVAKNDELQQTIHNLVETQRQLVEAEKHASLSRLVAGVAHEINTPVGVAVTASSHLTGLSQETRDHMDKGQLSRSELIDYFQNVLESTELVKRNLDRAANMVKSFKRIAVDQAGEQSRVFNLKEYLEDIATTLKPTLKHTRHNVRIDCPADLELDSFPGSFAQIFTNLIQNSMIHGFRDTDEGEMSISATCNGASLEIDYRDNGAGIPPDDLAHVFDAFYTTNRDAGGCGLGLNIVFNIVTQTLGGRIDVSSQPGEGVCFHITMPLKRQPD